MRGLARSCRRFRDRATGIGLVMVLLVGGVVMRLEAYLPFSNGVTVRPAEYLANCWLLFMLGAAFVVWTVLRVRGQIGAGGEMGFAVAALGVYARVYLGLVLYAFGPCYSDRSIVEETANIHGRVMIAMHRYGGLLAWVLGLAFVVLTALQERAGRARRAPRRSAARRGGAPAPEAPPSPAG